MAVEIITKEDLQAFGKQLVNDLLSLLNFKQPQKKEWLRSNEVKKMLKISTGTLQNLRITGKLKPTKIGGILFYKSADIESMLENGV